MNKWWDKLLKPLSSKEGRKINKPKYFIGMGLVGVLLILTSSWFQSSNSSQVQVPDETTEQQTKPSNQASDMTNSITSLESEYEKQLQPLLENIQGVSQVDIMVNLAATQEKVYDKNLIIGKQTTHETDKNGGEREIEDYSREQQLVLVRQGDREVPLLTKTSKPDVSGVFVTAEGVDQIQVKGWVVEAVSRVLDVPSHRISVLPK